MRMFKLSERLKTKKWQIKTSLKVKFDSMEWSHFLIIDDSSLETNVNLCDIIKNGSLVYMIDKEILPIFSISTDISSITNNSIYHML